MSENAKYVTLTEENFDRVLQDNPVVAVDFWATWCGPCKMIAPILEQIATEYAGKIKVAKANVDEQMQLAIEHKVEVIPTLFYYKDGKQINKTVGVLEKNDIVRKALGF